MNNTKLLVLAAKAAGIGLGKWSESANAFFTAPNQPVNAWWNPLINDGDALWLTIKLRIAITFPTGENAVRVWYGDEDENFDPIYVPLDGDPDAAVRLAVVLAAAELGKLIVS